MIMCMPMSFQNSIHTVLWFEQWHTRTVGQYCVSLVGLFVLCVVQELVSSARVSYARKLNGKQLSKSCKQIVAEPEENLQLIEDWTLALETIKKVSFWRSVVLSLLYGLNLVISYLLMLAVMTYNVGYFVVIVFGLMIGHLLVMNTTHIAHTYSLAENSAPKFSDVCCPTHTMEG